MKAIYLVVRIGCMLYVLYRLWMVLFRYGMFGIWGRLVNRADAAAWAIEPEKADGHRTEDVIGQTHVVYIEAPYAAAAAVPVRSEELPPSDFLGEEEEIPEDAVANTLSDTSSTAPPNEEELYEDAAQTPLDTEFSRGLTYDEISNVVGVLKTTPADVDRTLAAARTIFNLKNTDLFEFFTTQADNTAAVENLLNGYLDANGECRPDRMPKGRDTGTPAFQWDRYV